jgi:hypothetical protein
MVAATAKTPTNVSGKRRRMELLQGRRAAGFIPVVVVLASGVA